MDAISKKGAHTRLARKTPPLSLGKGEAKCESITLEDSAVREKQIEGSANDGVTPQEAIGSLAASENTYICVACGINGTDDDEAIQCDDCGLWWHSSCSSINEAEYNLLSDNDQLHWFCEICNPLVTARLHDAASLREARASVAELEFRLASLESDTSVHATSTTEKIDHLTSQLHGCMVSRSRDIERMDSFQHSIVTVETNLKDAFTSLSDSHSTLAKQSVEQSKRIDLLQTSIASNGASIDTLTCNMEKHSSSMNDNFQELKVLFQEKLTHPLAGPINTAENGPFLTREDLLRSNRRTNAILFKLREGTSDEDRAAIVVFLCACSIPQHVPITRIGIFRPTAPRPRPVRIVFQAVDDKRAFLDHLRYLRQDPNFPLFARHDQTPRQQEERRRERETAYGESNAVPELRNNERVSDGGVSAQRIGGHPTVPSSQGSYVYRLPPLHTPGTTAFAPIGSLLPFPANGIYEGPDPPILDQHDLSQKT